LANRNRRRPRKFYWAQVSHIQSLLERFVREQDASVDVDKYLRICEQLGEQPDPQKMPLTEQDFPAEVQVAFFMLSLLSDVWEGMSGYYMGKNWASCSFLFDTYEIEDRKTTLYFMKMYERILVNYRAEQAEKKRKDEERKAKSGGNKNYTHNVKG